MFKTKISIKDQDFASQDQDQDLFVMYIRGRPKMHFSFSAVNENADENEIPFTAENET